MNLNHDLRYNRIMRNYGPTKDTFHTTRSALAARILASPLAQFIGYPHQPIEDRQYVLRELAEGRCVDGRFIRVEFRKAGSNCDLNIDAETDFDGSPRRRDPEGNEYDQMAFKFTANWPCHGSSDVAVCLARLEFYRQVALLAAELKAEYGEEMVWKLVRTPAQREEQEAKEKAEKAKQAAIRAIDNVRSQMRVGSFRSAQCVDLTDVSPGEYEHQFSDNKTFKLLVGKDGDGTVNAAMVTRIS